MSPRSLLPARYLLSGARPAVMRADAAAAYLDYRCCKTGFEKRFIASLRRVQRSLGNVRPLVRFETKPFR